MFVRAMLLANIPWIFLALCNLIFFKLSAHDLMGSIFWYYFQCFIGILVFPVTSSFYPSLADRGYGIAKILGLLAIFYLNWLGTNIGIMTFSGASLSLCLMIILFLTHFVSKKENDLYQLMEKYSSHIIKVEGIGLIVFFLFLVILSLHPELHWGEKPMDLNLFNFSMRNITLPMKDPWFAGETMHYYYWGYYIFSGFAKMTGVDGEFGYALSMATIPTLMGGALYSLLLYLVKRGWLAFFGTFLILLASNFKAFLSIVFGSASFDMFFFWSSTRLFKNSAFAEYPSWSFLFADLHPHVMSLPFSTALILVLLYGIQKIWYRFSWKENLGFFFSYALIFGSLIGINGWDFLIYTLFCSLFFLVSLSFRRSFKHTTYFALAHIFGLILFLPMVITLQSQKKTIFGLWRGELNNLTSFFYHQGHWWVICLLMILPITFLHRKAIRWKVIFESIGFRLFIVILIISLLSENFVFMDRVNTIFKIFTNAYLWWGILAVISLRYFRYYLRRGPFTLFAIFSIIIINSVLIGSFFNIKALIKSRPFGLSGNHLEGSSYLNISSPSDYALINWIKENISGTPTIVERYSHSFNHSAARISTFTGVPTYLGWDGHVYVRGRTWKEINKRKRDIDFIFNSIDPLKVYEFVMKKNINFIVVGSLERKYYSTEGLKKFEQYKDIYAPLYTYQGSTIYGVGDFKNYCCKQGI